MAQKAKKPAKKKRVKARAQRSKNAPEMLTPRAALFAVEYLKDLNAAQAAIRAGFSEKGAKVQGSRLLTNVNVQQAIANGMQERAKATKTDAEWVLARLREEADADIGEIFDEHGGIRPLKEWPALWRKGLIGQLKVRTLFSEDGKTAIGTVAEIRPADRHRKLMAIGQHTDIGAFLKGKPKEATKNEAEDFMREVYGNSIRPGGSGDKVH